MIQLNYRDSRPIYEQIKDGLRRLVVTGAVARDEKLPSVRELAATLSINPNTIQKAYRDLEAEGFVYTVAGRGSFSAGIEGALPIRKKELMEAFSELVKEILTLSGNPEELKSLIDELSVQ